MARTRVHVNSITTTTNNCLHRGTSVALQYSVIYLQNIQPPGLWNEYTRRCYEIIVAIYSSMSNVVQTCLRKSSTQVSTRQTLGLLRLQKTLLWRSGSNSKLAVFSHGASPRQIDWLCSMKPTSQFSDVSPKTSPCNEK